MISSQVPRCAVGDELHRYENHADVVLHEKYRITKVTPAGYWIDCYSKPKFVLAGRGKRFAYPTEVEARESFFRRKNRQLAILRAQIQGVEGAIEALKENRIRDYSGSAFTFDDY